MQGFRKGGEILDITEYRVEQPSRTNAAQFYEEVVGASRRRGWREQADEHPRKHKRRRKGEDAYERVGEPVEQPVKYGIGKANIGYKLLERAGWSEGQGLGAGNQGMQEPLKAEAHKGRRGLGAASKRRGPQGPAAQPAPSPPPAQQQEPVAGPKYDPVALMLQRDAEEDMDTKRKRHQQVLQAEVDDKAGKAIQRYMYMAFNDVTGEPTRDANPLKKGRTRLAPSNPLL